ncbi:hypothetical protein QE370_000420 [Aeromicrobium sp. SORGH_AS981]|uniref:hypothetical protein n=1 Tax=Aeromicrobium sp. SORGH_AS_0981 TaxID=3041802 RepID=UPI00285D596A|nr:hypothetical protein [Aeromicrobium sp. SORGH_AS_0981]MDR6117236.1 hypothetical protein [Aeromicrobium sp. SORGH_AS_0981]
MSSNTTTSTKAAKTDDKKPTGRRRQVAHVLYREHETGVGYADAVYFGNEDAALRALARTHKGRDGWEYIDLAAGTSLSDAIQATKVASS